LRFPFIFPLAQRAFIAFEIRAVAAERSFGDALVPVFIIAELKPPASLGKWLRRATHVSLLSP